MRRKPSGSSRAGMDAAAKNEAANTAALELKHRQEELDAKLDRARLVAERPDLESQFPIFESLTAGCAMFQDWAQQKHLISLKAFHVLGGRCKTCAEKYAQAQTPKKET